MARFIFNNGRPAFQNTVPSLYIMAQLGLLIVKMKNSWRQYLGVWTSLRFARPGLYTGPAPLCWGDELLDLWPGWCGCCRATFATPHHQPTILFYGKYFKRKKCITLNRTGHQLADLRDFKKKPCILHMLRKCFLGQSECYEYNSISS